VTLPLNSQRLIALVTLRTTLTREQASGMLWPESPRYRAGARLWTTLWRLHAMGRDILCGHDGQLFLDDGVDVDFTS
jgi:DNA-binding SARP family transcriptional activator